ncbi:hypothetical protein WME73_08510 [Sorangium sp. So ce302]|uniref:hypothetical protein n=1 Tax=Sorangium sp. So ce302 TaxID=3133297 RepID=UPI003F5E673A
MPLARRPEQRAERLPLEQLHHQVDLPVAAVLVAPEVEHLDHVPVHATEGNCPGCTKRARKSMTSFIAPRGP